MPPAPGKELRGLARLFLRLGLTAFGGPAAHIAMMEEEVVRRRRWLTALEFMDLVSASQLLPGPTSTELALHIGQRRGGLPGLLIAGACFIVPAAALTLLAAIFYQRYGQLPVTGSVLYAIKPVLIPVIVQALLSLGRAVLVPAAAAAAATSASPPANPPASRTFVGAALVLAATAALVAGGHELLVLAGTGLAGALLLPARGTRPGQRAALAIPLPALAGPDVAGGAVVVVAGAAVAAAGPLHLFAVFLKIGSVLFGSGYVLLALLRAELVQRLHWLTEAQLLDAVAVGQVTPGPLFSTATFLGYLLGGTTGAAAASAGIFLPAFLFVAVSGQLLPRLRRSPTASAFLDGVNAASLALMMVVTWQLGRAAIVDGPTAIIALVGALALARSRASSPWLVAAGALLGLIRHLLG